MRVASRDTKTETKFNALAANLGTPVEGKCGARTELEKRAVKCFLALERAEQDFKPGLQFGQAMIDLREEMMHGRWMPRLEELGITYPKARYWMAVVEGKPINRGKKKAAAVQPTSWDAAADEFQKLSCGICNLYSSEPDGCEGLVELLHELAGMFGYELVKKGGDNA